MKSFLNKRYFAGHLAHEIGSDSMTGAEAFQGEEETIHSPTAVLERKGGIKKGIGFKAMLLYFIDRKVKDHHKK